jgi:hypothetical protein
MGRSGRVVLAELATTQWGLVTTAQAVAVGVSRVLLSRMAARGELDRVVHGVYAAPGAASEEYAELRALWLALDPGRTAEERLAEPRTAGVLSHATAARLHGLGDLLDEVVEVTVPTRRQSRRPGLRIHIAALDAHEVTTVDGLPVTTVARTVADLVAEGYDVDHVATIMAEGLGGGVTDLAAVGQALTGHLGTSRGAEVLAQLRTAAGLDDDAVDQALARTVAQRWPGIVAYLQNVTGPQELLNVWAEQQRHLAAMLPKVDTGVIAPLLQQLETQAQYRALVPTESLASLSKTIAASQALVPADGANRSALAAIKAARQIASAKHAEPDSAGDSAGDDAEDLKEPD